ncbi:MAG: nucleoside phosphorylase [Clostridiales bacterium]|nr:nucleoside phosphorylase [Clostridiales bacterium]
MLIDGKQMHIGCTSDQIGGYVILPGDPGRCEWIAGMFDDAEFVSSNREFTVWTGTLNGARVSVCSTGIGGPSAAIALEELVECGAHTFIRVGTCGGVAPEVHGGDLVVATAAVRQEGTSREYMPLEYPAAASFDIVRALADEAERLKYPVHIGVIQSKDSFYGEIRPERMPVASQLTQQWKALLAAGVLASEMESAALFVASAYLHVRCGTVLNVLWNDENEAPAVGEKAAQRGIEAAVGALRRLIAQDQNA